MSGEPKTLTLTFQEAVELLGREYRCALVFLPDSPDQRGDYWSTLSIDEEGYAVEDFAPNWEETMSAALGVPVVARDEAAELRAENDEADEPAPPEPNPLLLLADAIEETIGQALWGQTLGGGAADLDGRRKVEALLEQVRRLAGGEEQE